MPEFNAEVDIDVSEFVDACTSREKQELIDYLVDYGYIPEVRKNGEYTHLFINDETFRNSLDNLQKYRHLLSLDEEKYINDIANKFKHLV